MKTVITLLFSVVFIINVSAQTCCTNDTCYVRLDDMSGFDTDPYLDSLKAAACELVQVFPAEFQNQFKVYDFGFYFQNHLFEGGKDEIFQEAISDIPNSTPFYLIFGTNLDQINEKTEFFLELSLPNTGNFSCLSDNEFQYIENNLSYLLNFLNFELGTPLSTFKSKIETIKRLNQIVGEIVQCCDVNLREVCSMCFPSDKHIDSYLYSEGFNLLNVSVEVLPPSMFDDTINIKSRSLSNDYVTDYTNMDYRINNSIIDIEAMLEQNLSSFTLEEDNLHIYIINNFHLCNGTMESIEQSIELNHPNLYGIIYIRDNENSLDQIFAKFGGISNSDIDEMSFAAVGDLAEDYSNGVNSFCQLVDKVRETEDILIENGFTNIKDRIHLIRGIYYGTQWSMDYDQMASDFRNTGFNTYTSFGMPEDIRNYIDIDLYNILFNSPEVTDGNRGIDFGHIIIGMEARQSMLARNVKFKFHEATGLEACTWVGDIGAGAGKLALDRVSNPNSRAKYKFNTSHFGGWINLEGDIASYLIARGNVQNSAPPLDLDKEDYIADALEDYLILDLNGDWENRSTIFLNMITGGELNAKTINKIEQKVEDFGENYLLSYWKEDKTTDLLNASAHLKGAAKEMTKIFIDALQKGGERIKGELDPEPTPKGEPYEKYKFTKKVEELIIKVEEWLSE